MLNNRRCFSQVMPMKKEQGIAWNKKWQLKNNVIGNGQLFFESFDTTPEIIDKMKRSPDSSTPNEFDNLAVKPIFDRSWCKCNNYATDLVFSVLTMSVTYKLKSELWHKEIKSCYSSFSLPLLGSFIPWCVWYSDNFLSSNHLGASLTKNLSTSIYDLVLIYVCHFHHQDLRVTQFKHFSSFSLIISRYSCLHLGSQHPRIFS